MMVFKVKLTFLCFFLYAIAFSCSGQELEGSKETFERKSGSPINGSRIAWDYSSMQKLSPRNDRTLPWTGYARIRRLDNGALLAVYEAEGNVEIISSNDDGISWSSPQILFKKEVAENTHSASVLVNKSNGELIQLSNGDLLAGCNYRPAQDGVAPFSIAVKRSTDMGESWTESKVIFEAGTSFENGCWEPAFLQLPSGEVQVYFANEAPYTTSHEQEISMLSSPDFGMTWSAEPVTVSFREGHRDGMPVPVLAGDEILVSIEDNLSGQFQPYIVRTSVDEKWTGYVSGTSDDRSYALKNRLPESVYAGAPFLMKLPSGELILSYQTTENRTDNWELSTMEVAVGDKEGRNFTKTTRPFEVPLNREAKWNSISLWDENTIVAASTTSFNNPSCEVWMILGHIIPDLSANEVNVDVDGDVTGEEWGDYWPIFVGHKGTTNLKVNIGHQADNLLFSAKIEYDGQRGSTSGQEGVTFFLDAGNYCLLKPDTGLFKVFVDDEGNTAIYEGQKGDWFEIESEGLSASVMEIPGEEGYTLEMIVPFEKLNILRHESIRINCELNYLDEEGSLIKESVVNADVKASNTWCEVNIQ